MKKEKKVFKRIFLIGLAILICASGLFFARHVRAINIEGDLDLQNTYKVINMATTTDNADAATVEYVKSAVEGQQPDVGTWILDGTDLYPRETTWDVGVGTINPQAKFEVYDTSDSLAKIKTDGYIEVNSGIIPMASGTGNIGTDAKRWRDIKMSGTLYDSGTTYYIDPNDTGTSAVFAGSMIVAGDLTVDGFTNTKSIHEVSEQGLVGAWSLNKKNSLGAAGSETILDSSTENNHGTNHGATFTTDFNDVADGAMSFDGEDDYVDCGNDESLNFNSTDDRTFTWWMNDKDTSSGTIRGIISKGGISGTSPAGQEKWTIYIDSSQYIRFRSDSTGASGFNCVFADYNTGWHYWAFVKNGETGTFYRDGMVVSTNQGTAFGNYSNDINLNIGRRQSALFYFNGSISDVRIYNRALSEDEIKQLYLQKAHIKDSYVSQKDVTVDSGGNVGIGGTTSPQSALDIRQNTADKGIIIRPADGGSEYTEIKVSDAGAVNYYANDNMIFSSRLNIYLKNTEASRNIIIGDANNPTIRLAENGGNVGIGTTSPGAMLDVYSTGSAEARVTAASADNYAFGRFYSGTADILLGIERSTGGGLITGSSGHALVLTHTDNYPMYLGTNNAIRLTISNDGNVGIGTTSPQAKLHVQGDATVTGTLSAGTYEMNNISAGIYYDKDDTNYYLDPKGNVMPYSLYAGKGAIFESGNIGIGTTVPTGKLDIRGDEVRIWDGTATVNYATGQGDLYVEDNLEVDGNTYLAGGLTASAPFTISGDVATDPMFSIIGDFNNGDGLIRLGDIDGVMNEVLFTVDDILEKFTFMNGNVGIGVTNPGSKLTIEGGSANWGLPTPGTSVGSIHLDPGSETGHYGSAITWGASDSGDGETAQAGIYVRSDGSYGTKMYFGTTNSYATGSQVRMIIDHTGNVGVGDTTPTEGKLVVAGNVYIDGFLNTNDNYAATVGYVDSAVMPPDGYLPDDPPDSDVDMNNHLILNIGNAATDFTTGGGLNIAGNVGIGVTNPDYKLQVNGTIAPEATNQDLGTTALRWDLLANTINLKELQSAFETTRTDNDTSGQWTKVLDFDFNGGTYDEMTAQIVILGRLQEGNDPVFGFLLLSLLTNSTGNLFPPYIALSNWGLNNVVGKDDIVLVDTSEEGTAEGSLYIRINDRYHALSILPLKVYRQNNTLTFLSNQGFVSSLPTGTQHSASYANNYVNDLYSTGNATVVGKLTANEIDPPYSIDGVVYATYGHSTTGLKEETTGKLRLQALNPKSLPAGKHGEILNKLQIPNSNNQIYIAIIDFDEAEKGSDLWLFKEITTFGDDWNDLIVTLTPEGKANVWYEFILEENKVIIYGNESVKVSYRLVAPRFDWPERDTNLYNGTGKAGKGVGIFVR